MSGTALAEEAEKLLGRPFRLHGRDPRTGLDCIGLLAAALAATGREVDFPTGYRIRTCHFEGLPALAATHGFRRVNDNAAAGDVLLTRPGPGQLHLVIAATRPRHFIEAHAGIGRVILRPSSSGDRVLQHWRLIDQA